MNILIDNLDRRYTKKKSEKRKEEEGNLSRKNKS